MIKEILLSSVLSFSTSVRTPNDDTKPLDYEYMTKIEKTDGNLTYLFKKDWERELGEKYEDDIEAIVCVGFTNEVPKTVKELDYMSQVACQDGRYGEIAVAYTVWSRKRGAGREVINKLLEYQKTIRTGTKRLVTLSPLTPMATHFHITNGAKLISINSETQNFEYTW